MSEKKVVIKINKYIKKIGKNDLVLDNGSIVQVITQSGAFVQYGYAPLIMSKKLFNELKKYDLLYLDVEKTKKESKGFNPPHLFYFRFDIEKMERMGYEVAEE